MMTLGFISEGHLMNLICPYSNWMWLVGSKVKLGLRQKNLSLAIGLAS